jgi:D-alanine-D-alanine ligase
VSSKKRVAVIFGGRSAEHEISVQSAKSIIKALDKERFEPVLIGIDKSGRWFLNDESVFLLHPGDRKLFQLQQTEEEVMLVGKDRASHIVDVEDSRDFGTIDVAFPVLHGPYGEDGSVQGLFKLANIPYVGADILGSAVGMDKDVMKRLLRDAGIPNSRFVVIRAADGYGREALQKQLDENGLDFPLFVKPANLGSSVGITKARGPEGLHEAVRKAFRYDRKVIIEETIVGREIECAVLGNDDPVASIPGEIRPADEFYSYRAKYVDENGADLVIPADLDEALCEKVRSTAVETFRVLCCSGLARVDMFVTEAGDIYVNEINTLPGFTSISMYPKLFEASGIPYTELISRLIDLAFERHRRESELSIEAE